MKRLLLFGLMLTVTVAALAQQRAVVSKALRDQSVPRIQPVLETDNFSHEALPSAVDYWPPEEEIIGNTWYDLQSNYGMQNRIYAYEDGTFGAVFTLGFDYPNFTSDRGTGYNYYDGSAWGAWPTEKLESDRTGWPAYSALHENGEIVVSHLSGATEDGLKILTRAVKGTEEWNESTFYGPAGNESLLWPRMTTGGVEHSVIHLFALTRPVANNGTPYMGLDGALLYSQSSDGGLSWEQENIILDGMTSYEYTGFSADTYEIQAQGDNVAILVGDPWCDLMLFKSTDGGDNWVKTIIWEHPYPMWNGTPTDTFYCADGAHHFAFDPDGRVHVVFGINRALSVDGTAQSWFPGVGGIGYWNEDRPTFSNDVNALCPFSDCEYSELIEDYSLIGWTQDINDNGEIDILFDNIAVYQLGLSSMPQIHIGTNGFINVIFSSVTESYDNGTQNYRHLWGRFSHNGDFWGPFLDMTADLIHIFDECVFPSVASWGDDEFYLVYQADTEPGLAVRGDEDPYGENYIRFMRVPKWDVYVEENEIKYPILDTDVLQNTPNPFDDITTIGVNVRKATNITLEVANIMGQKVKTIDVGNVLPGLNKIEVDGSKLNPGLYFYTVKAGNSSITKKMIVE